MGKVSAHVFVESMPQFVDDGVLSGARVEENAVGDLGNVYAAECGFAFLEKLLLIARVLVEQSAFWRRRIASG